MEVKVQYVVDIEEIPEELTKRMPRADDLMESLAILEGSFIESDIAYSLRVFEKVKKQLYHLNRRILDLEGIARGYVNILEQGPPTQDIHLEDNAFSFDGIEETDQTAVTEEE